MRTLTVSLLVLALAGGGAVYGYRQLASRNDMVYRTEPAARGDLLASITATGTVEPEDVIDVGAQVVGQIKEFGVDTKTGKPIDYSSTVEQGSVLAHIDDVLYRAKVAQSKAQLESAKAQLESAKAQLESAKAKLDSAKASTNFAAATLQQAKSRDNQSARDWERAKRLGPSGAIAAVDFDTAQMTYETNRAAIAVSEASLAQAKANEVDAAAAVGTATAAVGNAQANVGVAKAAADQDQINLDYCTIKAPVKGIVIDRRVTIGQTVQSSFNTPSLFLLAKDLSRVKVWASVNEADMGQIHTGQVVRFTVDSHPNETFEGTVGIIRLNATNTNNVITYTVEVVAENKSGKLLPYYTTNLNFEVARRSNVLLVPNSALRYKPTAEQVVPEARDAFTRKNKDKEGPPNTGTGSAADAAAKSRGVVWVEDKGLLRPIRLRLGLTDGNQTEVLDGDLPENTHVVTAESRASAGGDDAANPFQTRLTGNNKK
jgi:HlyD family secretion protein